MHTLFYCILIYTILTTIILIISENRNPVKTLSWIIVLVSFPIVGFFLYLIFGKNLQTDYKIRLHKKHFSHHNPYQLAPSVSTSGISMLAEDVSGCQLQKATSIHTFTSGTELFTSLFDDIKSARHHIHLEYYIIEDDKLGGALLDLLMQKAKEGVEVRVIVDDVGSWKLKHKRIKQLKRAGVEFQQFLSIAFPFFGSSLNNRNHRKIAVIDGQIGYTGGMNVADRYRDGLTWGKWRDTHIRITGDATLELQHILLDDWHFCTHERLPLNEQYFPTSQNEGIDTQIVRSGPDEPYRAMMQVYLKLISSAKDYVYIETPYFMPNEAVCAAMVCAALSGIDIRLMIPAQIDEKVLQLSGCSFLDALAAVGVKIYFYRGGFNHSKMIVADDEIVSVGTANLDFRSLEHNFELSTLIYDTLVAKEYKQMFEQDLEQSERLDLKRWRSRSKVMKFSESLARLLSPIF